MIRTFHKARRVTIDVYSESKYIACDEVFDNCKTVSYNDCIGFEVIEGKAAEEIEAETDASGIDDNHEYLKLFLIDGNTATFRNSYVDMFLF